MYSVAILPSYLAHFKKSAVFFFFLDNIHLKKNSSIETVIGTGDFNYGKAKHELDVNRDVSISSLYVFIFTYREKHPKLLTVRF